MNEFKIRYGLNVRGTIGIILIFLLFAYSYILRDMSPPKISIAFYVLVLAAPIIRRFMKPRIIRFGEDELSVGNSSINLNNIASIHIDHHTVGIKPKNKWIVPPSLCFIFLNYEGLIAFEKWLSDQDVTVSKRRFMKWI